MLHLIQATAVEVTTGSNDTKYATPLALAGSKYLDQSGSKISATASGTDTYTATISPAITAYASGQTFTIKFTNANTASSTINLNSLGAKTIKKPNGQELVQGEITASAVVILHYNGTDFIALGGLVEETEGIVTTTDGTTYETIVEHTVSSDCVISMEWWLLGRETTSGDIASAKLIMAISSVAVTYVWRTSASDADNNSVSAAAGIPLVLPAGTAAPYQSTSSNRADETVASITSLGAYSPAGAGVVRVFAAG